MRLKQFNYRDKKDTPYQIVFNVGDGEVLSFKKNNVPDQVETLYGHMHTYVREFLKEPEDNFGYLSITANLKESETILNFEYKKGYFYNTYQQELKVKKIPVRAVSKQEMDEYKEEAEKEEFERFWRLAQIYRAWIDLERACTSLYDEIAEVESNSQLEMSFSNDAQNS